MSGSISCIVATFGATTWETLKHQRAIPSTADQGFIDVVDVHLPDGTLATARNRGAEEASGDWLLFLDGDDELEPGFGDAMRRAMFDNRNASTPLLYTPAVVYARRQVRPKPKIWPRMDFKVGNWCVIGTLITKSMFQAIGGFHEYGMYEDYALWAMASVLGAEVIEVPDAIYIAHWARLSRNRATPNQMLYWHQRVGRDVWPDYFEDLTAEEDETHVLATRHLRFLS